LAGVVEDDGVAVEDEFVVAADLVDVDDGKVPAFGLEGEEFVAVFVFSQDEGGGGDVEEEVGAGFGEGFDGVEVVEGAFDEFFIVPEVFADGDAERLIVDESDFRVWAGLEVAGFVEDVVGGEEGFEAFGEDFSIADDGDGVVEGSAGVGDIFFGGADDGGDAVGGLGDFIDGLGAKRNNRRLEEEVFGGVSEEA